MLRDDSPKRERPWSPPPAAATAACDPRRGLAALRACHNTCFMSVHYGVWKSPPSVSDLRSIDLQRRVELLTKLGPGTAQHGEMLTVLCEQLNYPKDLEDQLHKVSRSYGEDERYWPDYVKRYLFRKRLKQLDPSVLTLPTTEAESKGVS